MADASAPVTGQFVVPAALRICDQGGVHRLLRAAQRRGYVTFDEVNEILPATELSCEQIEAILDALHALGIAYET